MRLTATSRLACKQVGQGSLGQWAWVFYVGKGLGSLLGLCGVSGWRVEAVLSCLGAFFHASDFLAAEPVPKTQQFKYGGSARREGSDIRQGLRFPGWRWRASGTSLSRRALNVSLNVALRYALEV